jgi:hypothetical protein
VPVAAGSHAGAFNKSDYISFWISIFQSAEFTMQVIKGDIDNPFHLFSRHRSLQYFTSFQFLAHFLRHSKGKPQRMQILGSKPFLTFAVRDITQS